MDFNIRRISATFIDHLVFGLIAAFVALPGLIFDLIFSPFELRFHYGSLYLNSIALAIYFGKDLIMPNSPGKRVMKLILISSDESGGLKAYQLFLRNLTFAIWPIEILVEFAKPDKRIGDMIANTKVVENSSVINPPATSTLGRTGIFLFALVVSYIVQLQIAKFFNYINSIL